VAKVADRQKVSRLLAATPRIAEVMHLRRRFLVAALADAAGALIDDVPSQVEEPASTGKTIMSGHVVVNSPSRPLRRPANRRHHQSENHRILRTSGQGFSCHYRRRCPHYPLGNTTDRQKSRLTFCPFARCLFGPGLISRFFAAMARVLAAWVTIMAYPSLNFSFTVRSGTTRAQQRRRAAKWTCSISPPIRTRSARRSWKVFIRDCPPMPARRKRCSALFRRRIYSTRICAANARTYARKCDRLPMFRIPSMRLTCWTS
jgi:hypothetical protein